MGSKFRIRCHNFRFQPKILTIFCFHLKFCAWAWNLEFTCEILSLTTHFCFVLRISFFNLKFLLQLEILCLQLHIKLQLEFLYFDNSEFSVCIWNFVLKLQIFTLNTKPSIQFISTLYTSTSKFRPKVYICTQHLVLKLAILCLFLKFWVPTQNCKFNKCEI